MHSDGSFTVGCRNAFSQHVLAKLGWPTLSQKVNSTSWKSGKHPHPKEQVQPRDLAKDHVQKFSQPKQSTRRGDCHCKPPVGESSDGIPLCGLSLGSETWFQEFETQEIEARGPGSLGGPGSWYSHTRAAHSSRGPPLELGPLAPCPFPKRSQLERRQGSRFAVFFGLYEGKKCGNTTSQVPPKGAGTPRVFPETPHIHRTRYSCSK